jgi:signal transduction histidine kinase
VIVDDVGPGIPAAEQRTIFERGVRGSDITSDGSGLGLYVTARLLREMGGDIWLDPKRAYGASFTCCIPAAPDNVRVLHPDPVVEHEVAL